nr:DUF4158 domain-containing protein [Nonomuraea sp. SYSU D8015]
MPAGERAGCLVARVLDEDDLIGNWTLVGDELDQSSWRRGATKLGFALLLRFYAVHGRFPTGPSEIPDQAVTYVARLVDVPASELRLYEWDGRTIKAHRADIRKYFGFRDCTVADAEKAAQWLAVEVCEKERQVDRVREQLLAHLKNERIEPPTRDRLRRIIGSGLRWMVVLATARVSSALSLRRSASAGMEGAAQCFLVWHQASQEVMAARLRFQVAGAQPPHSSVKRGADLGVGDLGERPVAAKEGGDAVDVGAVGVGVGGARSDEEGVGSRGERDVPAAQSGDLRRGAHAGRRAADAVPARRPDARIAAMSPKVAMSNCDYASQSIALRRPRSAGSRPCTTAYGRGSCWTTPSVRRRGLRPPAG